jgi:hypothetical protein
MRCVFLCKTQQIKSKIKTVIKTFALNHPEILLDLKSTLRFNVSKTHKSDDYIKIQETKRKKTV